MKLSVLVVLFILAGCAAIDAPASHDAALPCVPSESITVAYATIDEAWDATAAVVRGTVVSEAIDVRTESARKLTSRRLRVERVFKAAPRIASGSIIDIYDVGTGSCDPVGEGGNTLREGEQFILFLGWNPYLSRWMVHGKATTIRVVGTTVDARGDRGLAKQVRGHSLQSLEKELEKLASRRR